MAFWYGLVDGSLLAWQAYRTGSLWMPIGWHWANNFGLMTLIDAKNVDVVQGMPLLVADHLPAIEYVILTKVVVSLATVLIVTWLINRREQSERLQ